ncbi:MULTISPECIES: acetyl-CoA C-acyltransferase [Rhodococcus]|jgi:acetyl-CoA acyltransferase|uniref:thiolase family protein n=1 Tax=Rhodococcus TaxID=1827 RepID=UPI0002D23504|nr:MULTISPECIES: acetyl-CoA C-acyltransferase [Rhodococcus]NCL77463.1 3-oxoadipyl-CoA/3-oxo-5,6-dehydrosuberyl-CoA thiolase [Rhodococcus sp. YH1]OOL31488.1 acetyl-CoA acetyltransferase [Rhodococcus rhodochrous]AKE91998.1 acetyl-CoA acetyltransferase [Rhodococcus aetherivorans]ANZ27741.1 acetyl-CoA acetyltransferase [Rhodococcus sp. WB1]KDE11121.1 acetyl-CoA acetyltransferase [Rhodococcus aetherivorans]
MRDAVIVDAVRTPIGRRGGALSEIHPANLSAHVLGALADRTGLDPASVEDVVWGCVSQVGEQAGIVSRSAVFAAGWPETVPATTVNRACGSSQQAVSFAAATVISGQSDVVVAGGVESMSRVPMGSASKNGEHFPAEVLERFGVEGFSQGTGAEMMAEKWGLSRTALDEYSLRSHELSAAATDAGAFAGQLAPIAGLSADEGIRRGGSLESLAKLKTVFKEDGVIHAGNSSQISDGAGALLITTSEYAAAQGWTPMARIHTAVVAADDPVIMLTGPIAATEKALKRSGLSIDEIGAFEINEAFAPVPLAWQIETGAAMDRLNPLGGAIGVGHPLGGSGAILMTRLVHHMRDNGIRYGLQSMCEAGGMANATILELL